LGFCGCRRGRKGSRTTHVSEARDSEGFATRGFRKNQPFTVPKLSGTDEYLPDYMDDRLTKGAMHLKSRSSDDPAKNASVLLQRPANNPRRAVWHL
jgi:hypothetical protein